MFFGYIVASDYHGLPKQEVGLLGRVKAVSVGLIILTLLQGAVSQGIKQRSPL